MNDISLMSGIGVGLILGLPLGILIAATIFGEPKDGKIFRINAAELAIYHLGKTLYDARLGPTIDGFADYQSKAMSSAVYKRTDGLWYLTLGIAGEAGEIANKVKKVYRDKDGVLSDETRGILQDEIGDVLWYIAMLCTEIKCDMGATAYKNLKKLAERKAKQTLHGEGDKR